MIRPASPCGHSCRAASRQHPNRVPSWSKEISALNVASSTRPASPTPSTTTTACSLKTTPTLTLTTTAMQMLPLIAATSFEHRGPQCLLILGRSTSPPLDQFPVRVCSCPLYYKPSMNVNRAKKGEGARDTPAHSAKPPSLFVEAVVELWECGLTAHRNGPKDEAYYIYILDICSPMYLLIHLYIDR